MAGLATLIPTTTTEYILSGLYEKAVLLNLANPQILAQSKKGSTVSVNVIPKLTAGAYSGSISSAAATSAAYTYNFDQEVYNSVVIAQDQVGRSVTDMQSMIAKFTEAEINAFLDSADGYLAGLYSHLYQLSSGASPTQCKTGAEVVAALGSVVKAMDQANIPKQGRWGVVGPGFHRWLVAGAGAALVGSTDGSIYTNGYVGRFYGIDFYQSNNIKSDTSADEVELFGYSETYAFSHMEPVLRVMEDPSSFGTKVEALYVYGGLDLGHATTDVRGVALFADTIP